MPHDLSTRQPEYLTIEKALHLAITHHKEGQLQDAERLYRSILQVQPNHPDANHNLGVLALQVEQPTAGLPHFKAALEANPNQGQYWLSYIDALIQTGQIGPARQVLLQADRQSGLSTEVLEGLSARLSSSLSSPEIEPSSQEMNGLLCLFNDGRLSEAEQFAKLMTVQFPQHGFGWKILGAVLSKTGRDVEALESMRKAVARLPHDADAFKSWHNI